MTVSDWLTGKSAETPVVSTVHHPLGHQGLWHTPSEKVPVKQELTAYQQNIARALMRQGHDESSAIAIATAAIEHWRHGKPAGGMRGKPTPGVQAAAGRAHAEWEALRASHKSDDEDNTLVNPWILAGKSVDRYEHDDILDRTGESGVEQDPSRAKPDRSQAVSKPKPKKRKARTAETDEDDSNPWLPSMW